MVKHDFSSAIVQLVELKLGMEKGATVGEWPELANEIKWKFSDCPQALFFSLSFTERVNPPNLLHSPVLPFSLRI